MCASSISCDGSVVVSHCRLLQWRIMNAAFPAVARFLADPYFINMISQLAYS